MTSPQRERPKLGWSDLRGARIGVWGLGREGAASVRKLSALGITPVLVDDSPRDAGVLATAEGGMGALAGCDVVIKTPGISRYRPEAERLRESGVTLAGGIGLWIAEADRDRVVCVTGTKGKSTTSSVLGHLITGLSELTGTGKRAGVGGNIGVLPYDPQVQGNYDYWVIEVSSYQATDLAFSPPVVAVTSLHPDHLPWHGGVEQYYRDKLSACSQAGADLTIANGDSDLLRERFPLLGPRVEWVSEADEPEATWMDALGLPGRHNRRNALIARGCLRALAIPGADDDAALAAAADGYRGLPSRLTTIGVVDGVTFVDDSLSTNVLPTLAALEAFPGHPVALIVGGQDRGIDYAELAEAVLARKAPTLLLTLPDSGPRISAAFTRRALPREGRGTGPGDSGLAGVIDCPDLETAVSRAFEWARSAGDPRDLQVPGRGGVVLLSPAAPSFGHFRDYRDRGDAFAAAMRDCATAKLPDGRPSLREAAAARGAGAASASP
jgi:UDP-N-acetylmuramoylalanine--D-glutamate ligase